MTPVRRWRFAPPQPVSRQRAVSPARLLAAQGADGHRHRRRRGHHLQHAAHPGEAYKVGQLQSYRLRASEAFYHATLGGAHALRLDDKIGNFAPGKEADFVVIDPT
jgi:N-acyl-D-aspartate/D-glutamate deacylase